MKTVRIRGVIARVIELEPIGDVNPPLILRVEVIRLRNRKFTLGILRREFFRLKAFGSSRAKQVDEEIWVIEDHILPAAKTFRTMAQAIEWINSHLESKFLKLDKG